jgi:TolA-binding protein
MTAVTKPEAVSMAEIHAIRQMTDAVGTLTRQVERMNSKVDDVRERVIRLEAREYERQIDDLSARLTAALVRIDGLESTRDKQTGAAGLAAWLTKNAPWLVAIFMAGLAAFGWKEGSPGQ